MIIINPMWIIFVQQFKVDCLSCFFMLPVEKGGMVDLAVPKLPFFTGGENIGNMFGTLYLNY